MNKNQEAAAGTGEGVQAEEAAGPEGGGTSQSADELGLPFDALSWSSSIHGAPQIADAEDADVFIFGVHDAGKFQFVDLVPWRCRNGKLNS